MSIRRAKINYNKCASGPTASQTILTSNHWFRGKIFKTADWLVGGGSFDNPKSRYRENCHRPSLMK